MRGLNDVLSQIGPDIVKQLASSEDEKLQRLSNMLEGVTRRAGLVGNPLEISGVTLAGEPLDWASYQGKVVLVTFWATWCAPCRAEIPHLLENYKDYHDRGFDIVAISVDDDREDLVNFLAQNSLPWTVLFDRDAPGEKMATKYGVFAIPQMILVGRDGKVVATGIRGHNLRPYLEKLIGPAENN
jgi:thiol-disulfide isomerase/thioredoxin